MIGETNSGKTVLGEWIAANRGGSTTDLNEVVRFFGRSPSDTVIGLARDLRHRAIVDGKVAVGEIAMRRRMEGQLPSGKLAEMADLIVHVENRGNHKFTATVLKNRSGDTGWGFEFTVGPK